MTNISSTHSSPEPGAVARASLAELPPARSSVVAVTVGATFGAVAFALCALWLGPVAGLAIALASTLRALWRRHAWSALAFVVAGALSAAAFRPSTTLLLLAALVYGAGLALASKPSRDTELLA